MGGGAQCITSVGFVAWVLSHIICHMCFVTGCGFVQKCEGGRTLPGKEDLIGMRWEEDGHLDEMFGLEDCCPPDPAGKDMVLIQRDEIPKEHLAQRLHVPS